jgi:hypothetical protein
LGRTSQFFFAVAFLTGAVDVAQGMTPEQFLRRFLVDPPSAFNEATKPVRKPVVKRPDTPPPLADAPLIDVPLPHLRPVTATAAPLLGYQSNEDVDAAPDAIVAAPVEDVPMPRLRPVDLLPALTTPDVETAKVASITPEPLPKLIKPPPAAGSICGVAIARLGVIATPLAPIEEGECGIEAPVAVSAFDGGAVDLSTKAIIDCHLAEELATWVADTVKPKVEKAFGGQLTGLRVAASYACRTRDSIEGAKLSEHAHGNAIDISGFRIGKRWIEVGPGWTGGGDDAAFLADVRKSACGPFTTVLGPGSDVFHTDHFHLDMMERRTAGPSKGLYCK